jgi:hypothetical protein
LLALLLFVQLFEEFGADAILITFYEHEREDNENDKIDLQILFAMRLPDVHKWNVIDFVPATRHCPSVSATTTVACVVKTTGNVLDFDRPGPCDSAAASSIDAGRTDSKAKVDVEVFCGDLVTCLASPSVIRVDLTSRTAAAVGSISYWHEVGCRVDCRYFVTWEIVADVDVAGGAASCCLLAMYWPRVPAGRDDTVDWVAVSVVVVAAVADDVAVMASSWEHSTLYDTKSVFDGNFHRSPALTRKRNLNCCCWC